MKVIISHDVDHLYYTDHLKDFYFPKLWIRSCLDLLKRDVPINEWWLRCATPFKRRMHRIDELMQFDQEHGIPSTFFFGMANGLGMSYTQQNAAPVIEMVRAKGFDVGVHGIAYTNQDAMKKEHDDFAKIIGTEDFGIRTHYVRYDDSTFSKLSDIGYTFDSSEFDKVMRYTLKEPYLIGDMWEFPLSLMDSYLPYNLEKAKESTLEIIKEAEKMKLLFFIVLFHDIYYSDTFGQYQKWYRWLIEYLKKDGHEFISFIQAIKLLEN
jgi:peptidoglycan/xylan/chitin deacetylase (PgdA/CDA1 family)